MQILLTSIIMLLMLCTMAVAKLTSYKELHFADIICKDLLQEHGFLIQHHFERVQDPHPPSQEEKKKRPFSQKQENKTRKRLSRFLNIGLLLDPLSQEHNPKYEATKLLFARLLNALYEDTSFYQHAIQQYPHVESRLIQEMREAAITYKANFLKSSSFKTQDIQKLTLKDPLLHDTIYRMLCGSKSTKKSISSTLESYYSFTDFIKTNEGSTIAHVWLAPKPILTALFQNPKIVADICNARKGFYREARRDSSKILQLSKEFENMFKQYVPEDIRSLEISFSISTAEPQE